MCLFRSSSRPTPPPPTPAENAEAARATAKATTPEPAPAPPAPVLPSWMAASPTGAGIIRRTEEQRTAPKQAARGPSRLLIPLAGSKP